MSKLRIYYLIPLLALCMINCNKPSDPPIPDYGPDYGDLKYTIEGVKDVSMERIGETNMSLHVKRSSGKLEDVLLTVRNLPQGATASFQPVFTGYPSFSTVLTIKANRVKAGDYDLIVRGSSTTSGFTDYNLKLTILPYSNAAVGLVGGFREQGVCTQGGNVGHEVDVVAVDGIPNRVNIKGFWSGVWSNIIYANLNPTNNTLTIPAQIMNDVTVTGSGTYDDNTMIVNYHVAGSTVNDNCSSTFSRL